MTEAEWLTEADPHRLLYHLGKNEPGERKLRLFCICCARRLEANVFVNDEYISHALAIAERFADAESSLEELAVAESEIEHKTREASIYEVTNALRAVAWTLSSEMDAIGTARSVVEASALAAGSKNVRSEKSFQAQLLREVFGNPFRPKQLPPECFNPDAVNLAQEMYSTQNFQSAPSLADLLKHAGCTDSDVLSHLRSPVPHVRGCWAIDLVLGKQ